MNYEYKRTTWYRKLDHGMRDLVDQSLVLLAEEQRYHKERFHDYSFVVFPIAKAYEGYLKKLLFEMGLIDQYQLDSRHFRIGRSLNPDLPDKYKDEDWLFDEVQGRCVDVDAGDLAELMWKAWSEGRNALFHYFTPDHANFIDLHEAHLRVRRIIEVMERVAEVNHNVE